MKKELPAFFSRLFRWFCNPEIYEELQGDLEEAFFENIEEHGIAKAKRTYRKEVLKMIRPSVLKHAHLFNKHLMTLPKNYLKTSLRAFKLHPFYVSANVFGLALALSICTIGYFNYRFNKQFNTYFEQADNLYKVHGQRVGESTLGKSSIALAPALKTSGIPAFRYLTKSLTIQDGSRLFGSRVAFADPDFLTYFPFISLEGKNIQDPQTDEIVISESLAMKLFNEPYPVGELITIIFPNKEEGSFLVKDVFEELPTNVSFVQSAILPLETYLNYFGLSEQDWSRMADATFVFAKKQELVSISDQINTFLPIRNENNSSLTISNYQLDNVLVWPAFEDTLYGSRFRNHLHPSSVYGITGSAITILLLACFNFINTSIALSGKRLKEIAVRKILGGTRKSTTTQFLIENTFMITLAVILSFGISWLLIPQYNALFRQELIQMEEIPFNEILIFSVLIILIVTVLAAAYPSLYISKFSALKIFQKKLALAGKNRLMAVLLTFQFALCFYNIFGLFITIDNAEYQANLDRGYDVTEVINIPLNSVEQYQILEDALNQNPSVQLVSGAANLIGFTNETENINYNGIDQSVSIIRVGQDYPETLGLRLNKGSYFEGSADDVNKVLINKMLEDQFGKDLLNEQLRIGETKYNVVGVVDNFNLKSIMLENKITPTIIKLTTQENYLNVAVRISGIAEEANDTIEEIWYEVFPNELYPGFLQKQVLENARELNVIFLKINSFLAIITILISVLGLYTLISLKVQRMSKEFGVRKVLGATRFTIVHLLGKELYWMVGIAAVIGLASGAIVLKTVFDIIYAYHVNPETVHFVKAALVVLLIVGSTVGYKVYKIKRAY